MPSEDRKNRQLRNELKTKPCVACGKVPSDAAHIRSFRISQSDHPANVTSLCRKCHQNQHHLGWARFLNLHPHVRKLLESMGWEITEKLDGVGVYLSHPDVN